MQCKCGRLLDYTDAKVVECNRVFFEAVIECPECSKTYSTYVEIGSFVYNEGSGDGED